MKKVNIGDRLADVALKLEIIVTVLLAIGIMIGLIDIVKYFYYIFQTGFLDSYTVFKQFLGHVLLIIVGVELMLMLIYHSTNAILELVLFVIARKMLIYAETMLDLVLGASAIAIIFLTIKYLAPKKSFDTRNKNKGIYSASTLINNITRATGFNLPLDKGNTLGGLAFTLAEENNRPIEEGVEFFIENIKVKILKASDGVIEKVLIEDIDEIEEE